MIEIRQGDVEAFRFASRGKVILKDGKIAGYSIPSYRVLLSSRVVDFVVILLSLLCYVKRVSSLQLVPILWVVQAVHAAIKISVLWKPIRLNPNRTFDVITPRVSLQVEHTAFMVSLIFLCTLSLHESDGYMSFLWILVMLVCIALLAYSGLSHGSYQRL